MDNNEVFEQNATIIATILQLTVNVMRTVVDESEDLPTSNNLRKTDDLQHMARQSLQPILF